MVLGGGGVKEKQKSHASSGVPQEHCFLRSFFVFFDRTRCRAFFGSSRAFVCCCSLAITASSRARTCHRA